MAVVGVQDTEEEVVAVSVQRDGWQSWVSERIGRRTKTRTKADREESDSSFFQRRDEQHNKHKAKEEEFNP